MSADPSRPFSFPDDVAPIVERQMASGRFSSEQELVRVALVFFDEHGEGQDDDWEAIRQALTEIETDDPGLPVDGTFAELRRELGMSGE